ncbi:MAG: hypothetical protein ABUS79_09720, partial [Pseudomonadota bacterium]
MAGLLSCACSAQNNTDSPAGAGGQGGRTAGMTGTGGTTSGSAGNGASSGLGGSSTGGSGTGTGGTGTGATTGTGGAGTGGAGTGGAGTGTAGNSGAAGSGTATGGSGTAGSGSDPGTMGDGDVTVGPNYQLAADLMAKGAPTGKSFSFTMSSTTSKIFTGLDTTLTAPKTFTRQINVYVPAKYKDGTPAPFMVVQDGAGSQYNLVKNGLDNLSQSTDPTRHVPAFVLIAIANGGGDGMGSER